MPSAQMVSWGSARKRLAAIALPPSPPRHQHDSLLLTTVPHSPTPATCYNTNSILPWLNMWLSCNVSALWATASSSINWGRMEKYIYIQHTAHRCGVYRAVVYCKLHLTYVKAVIPAQIYDCKILFHAWTCTIFRRRHVIVFECKILPNLATQDFTNHSTTDTILCW